MEQEVVNSTIKPHLEQPLAWYDFMLLVTGYLGCIVCIVNAIIIFANKSLHSRKYYSIAAFCLSYALYLFICPTIFEIIPRIQRHVPQALLCILAYGMFVTWFSTLAFLQTLLLDWYVENHCSKSFSTKYLRASKYIAVSIGVVAVCMFVPTIFTCPQGKGFPIAVILALLTYFAVSITIIVLTIIHIFKGSKNNIEVEYSDVVFYIVVGYFVCWLGHLFMIIWTLIRRFMSLPMPLFILINCVTFLNPIVTFCILYKFDSKFRACICKFRGRDEVDDMNIDAEAQKISKQI